MGFFNHFTQACDGTSATFEVLFGLGIAALLGFLLGVFLSKKNKEEDGLNTENIHSSSVTNQVYTSSNDSNEIVDLSLKLDNANLEINRMKELNSKTESDLKTCYDNSIAMAKRYDVSTPTITKVETITISPPVIAAPIIEAVKVVEPIIEIPKAQIVEAPVIEIVKVEEVELVADTEAPKEVVKKPSTKKVAVIPSDGTKKKDDLKIIEGIGPAIEKLFNENEIYTFSEMIAAGVMKMNSLMDGNPRFRVHDASTWVDQAMLLDQGRVEEFEKLTAKLKGGKKK
jgi:predicted flap endonuclease-1-like 5' DNA nuclease